MEPFPIEYLIIILWLFICLIFNKSKVLLYSLIIYMTFLAVFRGDMVGSDYPGYIDLFKSVNENNLIALSVLNRTEVGFLGSMLAFKYISSNYCVFFGIQFLLFFIGFWRYCKYKEADTIWSLLILFFLGFYFKSFNGLRQMMAIGMILFFMPWLEKRKYLLFSIVVVGISILFHTTELVFLLLVPLKIICEKGIIINKMMLLAALLVSYVLFFVNHSFLYNIGIGGAYGDQFNHYFSQGEEREEISNLTGTAYTLFAIVLLYSTNINKYKFEISVVILSFIIFNITSLIHIAATRLSLDFMIILCPLISLLIYDKTSKQRFILALASLVVTVSLFIQQFIINNNSEIKPYYFNI